MIKWVALALATAAAATTLVSSAGAAPQQASALTASLTSRAAASAYLRSLGINPVGVTIQRGAHNYAGPNCPGKGWTCTRSTRVLQVSQQAGRANQVECGPDGVVTDEGGDCEIVQVSSEATNSAECNQSSGDANANERCVIFQTNSIGSNIATVNQSVDTANSESSTQNVTQYIGINQQNGNGSNQARIGPNSDPSGGQSINESGTPFGSQSQDASQQISLTQKSTGGDNNADIAQSLTEDENANADGGTLSETQNTNTREPNTNTGITQTSNSGANDVNMSQSHELSQSVSSPGTGSSQTQGAPGGGINSVVDQQSSGLSSFTNHQSENQFQFAPGGSEGIVAQTQYGPMWSDPQQGNPGNVNNLTQDSSQQASNPDLESDQLYMNCDSSGICDGTEAITQFDHTHRNGCDAPHCHIGLIVINGVETTCTDTCPPQPGPPPPPDNPSGTPPTCALIGTVDGPPKQIKIQVEDAQGVDSIDVDQTNATSTFDPPTLAGSPTSVVVTATKTLQDQRSFIRLTIMDSAGLQTVCDPIVPAVHKRHAAKKAKSHASAAHGRLALQVDASRLVYGQSKQLTFTGRVPNGKPGQHVALLSSTCGFKGAAPIATLTTRAGGAFTYRYAPAISASFAVRWNNLTSAKKPVRVQPQIVVTKTAHGRYRVDVSTTNGVFLTGTKVTLEALAGGHWKSFGQGLLSPNSANDVMTAVSSATIVKAPAGRTLRARVPATACYAQAASAPIGG